MTRVPGSPENGGVGDTRKSNECQSAPPVRLLKNFDVAPINQPTLDLNDTRCWCCTDDSNIIAIACPLTKYDSCVEEAE